MIKINNGLKLVGAYKNNGTNKTCEKSGWRMRRELAIEE